MQQRFAVAYSLGWGHGQAKTNYNIQVTSPFLHSQGQPLPQPITVQNTTDNKQNNLLKCPIIYLDNERKQNEIQGPYLTP